MIESSSRRADDSAVSSKRSRSWSPSSARPSVATTAWSGCWSSCAVSSANSLRSAFERASSIACRASSSSARLRWSTGPSWAAIAERTSVQRSSSVRRWSAKKPRIATTSPSASTGIATPAAKPTRRAVSILGPSRFVVVTSTQAARLVCHTKPGSPSPGHIVWGALASTKNASISGDAAHQPGASSSLA